MKQVIPKGHHLPNIRQPLLLRRPLGVLNYIQFPQSSFPPPTSMANEAWSPGKRSSFNPAVGWPPIIVFCIPTSLYLDVRGTAWYLNYNQAEEEKEKKVSIFGSRNVSSVVLTSSNTSEIANNTDVTHSIIHILMLRKLKSWSADAGHQCHVLPTSFISPKSDIKFNKHVVSRWVDACSNKTKYLKCSMTKIFMLRTLYEFTWMDNPFKVRLWMSLGGRIHFGSGSR